jgi:uncharacterized membrane protein YgcG
MANTTDPLARSVHGTNPQNLVEKITRQKIYDMTFWKERCFGVSAEALVDLATELRSFGGIYGGNAKATDFLCLTLKMLQIQPDHEIVLEFVRNEDYKYVRLLGALYLRLVGKPVEVYQYLEPLLNDYRKVRHHTPTGAFALTHVDEFVWDLLSKDQCCDIALPRIPDRVALENTGQLEPRRSAMDDEADEAEAKEEAKEEAGGGAANEKRGGSGGGGGGPPGGGGWLGGGGGGGGGGARGRARGGGGRRRRRTARLTPKRGGARSGRRRGSEEHAGRSARGVSGARGGRGAHEAAAARAGTKRRSRGSVVVSVVTPDSNTAVFS